MTRAQRFREWFVKGMKNGLKLQIAISILTLGAIIGLILQVYSLANVDTSAAFTITKVSVTKVDEQIVWSRTVCNRSNQPIAASITTTLISAPPEREVLIPGTRTANLPPGCTDQQSQADLPELDPGEWRLRVSITATSGGNIALENGTSDPFVVKGSEGGE